MSDNDATDAIRLFQTGTDAHATTPRDREYTGSFVVDNSDLTITVSDDTTTDDTTTDDDLGYLGVPLCPECGEHDSVRLATGEWICQQDDCNEVYDHDP